jgi:hypothetical protein
MGNNLGTFIGHAHNINLVEDPDAEIDGVAPDAQGKILTPKGGVTVFKVSEGTADKIANLFGMLDEDYSFEETD